MLLSIYSIAAYAASVAALHVTTPAMGQKLDFSKPNKIEWNSVRTDPETCSVELVNNAVYPPVRRTIADHVSTAEGSYTMSPMPGLADGSGYQVNLVSKIPQNEGILAQSSSVDGVNSASGGQSSEQSRSESESEQSPTGKDDSDSNSESESESGPAAPDSGSPLPNTAESNLPPSPNSTPQWTSGEEGSESETQRPPSTPTGSGSVPFPTETGTGTGTNTEPHSEGPPMSSSPSTRSAFIIPSTSPPTFSSSAFGSSSFGPQQTASRTSSGSESSASASSTSDSTDSDSQNSSDSGSSSGPTATATAGAAGVLVPGSVLAGLLGLVALVL